MKSIIAFPALLLIFLWSCGSRTQNSGMAIEEDTTQLGAVRYVELSETFDQEMIKEGRFIFEQRCDNCHSLETKTRIGPGFAGVTNRRTPEWIMNMILNVNIMLEHDSTAHQLAEELGTKMPDHNLPVDQARSVLEFFRSNDLEKTGRMDDGISMRTEE